MRRKKMLTNEEFKKMTQEYSKVKYTCKCSHRVIISNQVDKVICSHCGNYVFKNKKDEFIFRMKEKMKR